MEVEKLENIKLYNGDCMEVMKTIPDNSIDLIITDLLTALPHVVGIM